MIATLEPIGLTELTERAGLLTRIDRKYLVPTTALDQVLITLPGTTRVLQIDDRRQFGYRSVYFDTADLVAYRLTAPRRRRRFKIRTRSYLGSDLHLLEVKTRGPRGTTVKQRVPYGGDAESLGRHDRAEAYAALVQTGSAGRLAADELQPTVITNYHRTTLFMPQSRSRVTIDTGLTWTLPDGTRQHRLGGYAVVETKCAGGAAEMDRAPLGVPAPSLLDLQVRHGSRGPAARAAGSSLALPAHPTADHEGTRLMITTARRRIAGLAALAVLGVGTLAGCGTAAGSGTTSTTSAVSVSATQTAAEVLAADKEAHAADDTSYDASAATTITLDGDSAEASGDGSDSVDIDGSTVTITGAGSYVLSGTLTDGQLIIDAADAHVTLVLDGVDIASTTGAAVAAVAADEITVITAEGSENTLSDTDSYADDAEVNAALYSSADLILAGSGSLTVKGNGNDGIASTDGLLITSGTVTVTAKDDGIRGKDYVVVTEGTITVTSGGDAVKADNGDDTTAGYVAISGGTLTLTATAGDGIDAATDLVVTDGTVNATTGGGHTQAKTEGSTKGLKSGVITVLEGGTVTVAAGDDALHSHGATALSGSEVSVASADDAVHAEDELVITAGSVGVTSSVEGLEAAHITIAGGDTRVTSSDDGVNAAGGTIDSTSTDTSAQQGGDQPGGMGGGEEVGDYSLTITGGTLVVDAEGDGLDSTPTAPRP